MISIVNSVSIIAYCYFYINYPINWFGIIVHCLQTQIM